ncbi:HAD family hydrolase [Thermoactinomyces mirandus]|uniref:HAD family phosphatase n=1 Tax=Thermoactinomyces mirandus TaxID=2756294 RepID=A0A7W1XV20_9BACL|nr:HAD family phosphatase [Thermoactinomyces mirandus]MBA4603813.1 HAD family phosphatase [Thermoactinomyces mirandus]
MTNVKKQAIKAVIFDLDGTLVDSEPNYFEAEKKLFAEYGINNFDFEMKKKYVGKSTKDTLTDYKKNYSIEESVETLTKKMNKYYLDIAKNNTVIFPEMRKFLELLKANNYRMALASGSSSEIIDEILFITGLKDFFDVTLSSESVRKGKPAPDVFLEAAKLLGIPPENCLVLEDSNYGVEAAKNASMYCIAIPYFTEKPLAQSFLMSDLLLKDGIKSFSAEKAFKWMRNIHKE